MLFTVVHYKDVPRRARTLAGTSECYLLRDNWDDYTFKTTFRLVYFDSEPWDASLPCQAGRCAAEIEDTGLEIRPLADEPRTKGSIARMNPPLRRIQYAGLREYG